MKKAVVILNKKSGRKKKHPVEYQIIEQLTGLGYEAEILYTPSTGARTLALQNAKECDLIVSVGGDGTIGEIIGGITESGGNPLLTILPAGTVNDYARTLGLPLDFEEAVEALSRPQKIVEADAVEYNGKYAGYLIALGDFMESFTRVRSETKNRYGTLAYLYKGIRGLMTMKPYDIKIETEEEQITASSLATIVANASSVGSFSRLLPDAALDDGALHVLNIKDSNTKDILEIIWLAMKGRIAEHKNVRYIKSRQLKITADRLEVMNVDGDAHPFGPLGIKLVPGRIRISIPEKSR